VNPMKRFITIFIFLLSMSSSSSAENFTLSSFYPSPFGAFDTIRLMPIDTASNPVTCDENNKGLMYYDGVSGLVVVCGDTSADDFLVWRMTATNLIYPIDTADDVYVGIGDFDPDAMLEVSSSGLGFDLLLLSSDDANDGDVFIAKSTGNIGMGSSNPLFRLTIDQDSGALADGGILAFGELGSGADLQASGAGTRFFWYPKKAAFRAGTVTADHWDNVNIGLYSSAMGFDTMAMGEASVSIGSNNTAAGDYSVSIGDFSTAIEESSVAIGYSLTSHGRGSIVFGKDNQINDPSNASAVFGALNQVVGDSSIAFGKGNTSLFTVSAMALGFYTGSFGLSSISMGYFSQAAESFSVAMGYNALANEILSTSIGYSTSALGFASTAIGLDARATGMNASAFGRDTLSQAFESRVFGQFNIASGTLNTWIDTESILIVGNGTSDLARSNALTILKNGTTIIAGDNPEGYILRIFGGDAAVDAVSSWAVASDRRLKKDIVNIENVLDELLNLRAVKYHSLEENDSDPKHIGFIAQEVEKAFPEIVITSPEGYKGIDYLRFSVMLVEAIKELKIKNEDLKNRINILNSELEQL